MKLIKPALIGLAGVLVVLLGLSALQPKEVMTCRWVMVGVGKDSALREIRNLAGWKDWNLLLKDVPGVSVGPVKHPVDTGGFLKWKDVRAGENLLRITENNEKGLVGDLKLGDNRPMVCGFSIEQRRPDSTQVVWFIIEKMKWYPWEKFYGMMAANMKGPLMQESLNNLKSKLEQGSVP